MKTRVSMHTILLALTLSLARPAGAGPAPCTGDCDTSNTVIVSEIVLATNIGLGTQPITRCQAADPDGDGVGVNDLVASVLNSFTMCGVATPPTTTPTPSVTPTLAATSTPTATPTEITPTIGAPVCGNGVEDEGETCDDGGFCTGDSVNISCEDNKQNCPSGRQCVNRFCVCQNDQQCESGHQCVEGFCMRRCTDSDDCPSGVCEPAGGDGCAANCTDETTRVTQLDTPLSPSRVQTTNTVIDLDLAGVQRFRTGQIREDNPVDPQGNVITGPGEIPVVIKADAVNGPVFDPVPVPGLVCACVRQIPVPDLFGPNNSGVGKVGCATQGLVNVDYKIMQDHNTNPGDPNNGATTGLPIPQFENDPECDNEFTFPSGVVSPACKELSGDPLCNDGTAYFHPGICNSPRMIEFSGGQAPRGSALIDNSTGIGLLADNGVCRLDRPMVNGMCQFRDYGPDCLPCTPDDVDQGTQENLPTTTGTAKGAVYDAGNVITPGFTFPVPIDEGSEQACSSDDQCAPHERCRSSCSASGFPCTENAQCPEGETCQPRQCEVQCGTIVRCLIAQTGTEFDCDALLANPTGGLSGAALAVTFPDIDAKRIGDNVTASILALE
jgi:hypothetical protein